MSVVNEPVDPRTALDDQTRYTRYPEAAKQPLMEDFPKVKTNMIPEMMIIMVPDPYFKSDTETEAVTVPPRYHFIQQATPLLLLFCTRCVTPAGESLLPIQARRKSENLGLDY